MKPRQVTPTDYQHLLTDREKAHVARLMKDAGLDEMDVAHIEIREDDTVFTVLLRDDAGRAYMCCAGSTDVATRTVMYP